MKYHVYGDYGRHSECELFDTDDCNEAKRWAEAYTRHGNFGGYNMIEVISFSENNDVHVHWLRVEESEPDWGALWYDTSAELA